MSKTSALAKQQHDLLNAIFTTNNIAFEATNTPTRDRNSTKKSGFKRGLQTYQANAAASAQRSLQTAYPVITQLIGDEAFEHLAYDFWDHHPPKRGDLAQWGCELTAFIGSIPAMQSEPYLSDVARTEWALHTCATAADKVADLSTFALLTEHDPDTVSLQLAPGTALIQSEFPVASILTAHLYGAPNFEEVGQKLQHSTAETALIWRQDLRPMVAACTVAEAAFIARLLAGSSLLTALESDGLAASDQSFDLQLWLPQALEIGLLLGVRAL